MSRMTKERRADLEKLADEDPHMCLLRELLNEIDALQRESAQLLKEQVRLLREAAAKVLDANCGDPWGLLDEGDQPRGGLDALKAALEATKEGT